MSLETDVKNILNNFDSSSSDEFLKNFRSNYA